jgi:uncharacterized protein (DUF1330 family)
MAAYVIAQMRVHDPEKYREYASKVGPTVVPHGGEFLAATDAEVREGAPPYVRTIIGQFPSLAAARSWYDSDAYQAILPLRLQSTIGTLVMLEGFSLPPATNL